MLPFDTILPSQNTFGCAIVDQRIKDYLRGWYMQVAERVAVDAEATTDKDQFLGQLLNQVGSQ